MGARVKPGRGTFDTSVAEIGTSVACHLLPVITSPSAPPSPTRLPGRTTVASWEASRLPAGRVIIFQEDLRGSQGERRGSRRGERASRGACCLSEIFCCLTEIIY